MVRRGWAERVLPGEPPRRRSTAILVACLLLPMAFAGCLGADAAEPADAGETAAAPINDSTNDVPHPRIELEVNGTHAILRIHLDGDIRQIGHHQIDWGDGDQTDLLPGPPPNVTSHQYPQPGSFRDGPYEFRLVLTLIGIDGQRRTAATEVTIQPPPNRPPDVRLDAEATTVALPGRITFTPKATDPDGDLRGWTFDPGDGSASVHDLGAPPGALVHIYRTIGQHQAILTATDGAGHESRTVRNITILPPQNLDIWTIEPSTRTGIQHDANGTIRDEHPILPHCTTSTCGTIVDAVSSGGRVYVLLDQPISDRSILVVLDGRSGDPLRQHHLPAGAVAVADTSTHIWTTHRDGTITWTSTGGGPTGIHRPPLANSTARLAFEADGTAWAIHPDTTTTLVTRIDPALSQYEPLSIALPTPAAHVATNHKHGVAVVVDADARAWILGGAAYSPHITGVTLLSETPGTPRGVICPGDQDLCWVALDGPDILTPFDVTRSADIPSESTITLRGHTLHGLAASGDALIVPVTGSHRGAAIIDPATGTVTYAPLPGTGGAPQGITPLGGHVSLSYQMDPKDASWWILDASKGRYVHQAAETGGPLGPLIVPHPPQLGRTR